MEKKDGGIRPIAVGCTLRRLVAKIAGNKVTDNMSSLLAPRQLGFGVKGGAEAAVHAARQYLHSLPPDMLLLKLDFSNAFNSIRRDKMLLAVKKLVPELYPLVHSAYSSPSSLFWGDKIILSAEGVQQGDPLGPLLFCLTLHNLISELTSELILGYLDDVTFGGSLADVSRDVQNFELAAKQLGLKLNHTKTEVITNDPSVRSDMLLLFPNAQSIDPRDATLLGSPIGDISSITAAISKKRGILSLMGERLQHIFSHDAILLLRNAFAIPKLLYLLRTSSCFLSPTLQSYDDELRKILCSITNICLGEAAWTQATLPVHFGGLGIRSAVQLAPSAFLASLHSSQYLVNKILPPRLLSTDLLHKDIAISVWSQGHQQSPPQEKASFSQKAWDSPRVEAVSAALLDQASDAITRARLLAVSRKESGAWLHAVPNSSLGLRMDNETIRVAVGLRLGVALCSPHSCQHCGAAVDQFGLHGLSCRFSTGRHYRHAALNEIIHRALTTSHIPSRLEPTGLDRSDGKRPDGITMVPWKNGNLLVWDATCSDTYAPSHLAQSTMVAGAVASQAEDRKKVKYSYLDGHPGICFTPIAYETSGVVGPLSQIFLKELGHRLSATTGDTKSYSYLLQRLSVAVQRGNAASILGTLFSPSFTDF